MPEDELSTPLDPADLSPATGGGETGWDPSAELQRLRRADLEIIGRMPDSSNITLLVHLDGDDEAGAIYKPVRGERPLWDFPPGLHRREAASFELARWLGWPCIPPTVVRDGPFGEGSVQALVDADYSEHHFTLVADERHHEQLRRLAVFDLLANNTDRKSGHCLIDGTGAIWGIDNGLCFAAEFKLRTVIWDFAGEPIDEDLLDDVARIEAGLPGPLGELLSETEIEALGQRCRWVLRERCLPVDHSGHRYPWPLV